VQQRLHALLQVELPFDLQQLLRPELRPVLQLLGSLRFERASPSG
jgi:hypothetical protein